jgi:uncharacterized protein YggE
MTENFKKYLWIAGSVLAVVLTIAVWRFADAYTSSIQPSSFRSFTVSGQGKATSIPDVAELNFSVLSEGGKDIASLQNQNTSKMNAAIDFVKGKGVDSKDIKTSSYSITPRYQNYSCSQSNSANTVPCPPSQIVGYSVSQTVTVKARDFSKIGDILSGVVDKGVNSVSGPYFTMDDPNGPQNEARAKAIQNAEERAKVIAKAGNFSIGRLLSIEDQNQIYYPTYGLGGGMADKSASTPPTIEPGSQETTANVVLRYEIK